jgi:non-heme chloroperoxidase
MDTYADDLATLVEVLDLKNVIHVGHSTGSVEVVRYIGLHGTKRLDKALFVGAIPLLMMKTETNLAGTPSEEFDKLREATKAESSHFWKDLSMPFYGYNRQGAKISEGVRARPGCQGRHAEDV